MTYEIDEGNTRDRIQVKILPKGQTVDLGVKSQGQISLHFNYKVNLKDSLNQTVCVFSQIKYITHIERNVHSIAWACPGVGHGVPRGQKF